jgi:hypothetical protein
MHLARSNGVKCWTLLVLAGLRCAQHRPPGHRASSLRFSEQGVTRGRANITPP